MHNLHTTPSCTDRARTFLKKSALRLAPALFLICGFFASSAKAQVLSTPYDKCGTLFSGIVCVFFLDEDGDSLSLANTGPYNVGDTFRVRGDRILLTPCVSTSGTIINVLTGPCNPPGQPYDKCGTLLSGIVCVFFLDDDGNSLSLDNYAPANIGDRFRVQGTLVNLSPCVSTSGLVIGSVVSQCPSIEGDSYCFGDGGVTPGCTPCPCGNNMPPGTMGGCRNSTGQSCRLIASGQPSVSQDSLRFRATRAAPDTFGMLVSAMNRLPANAAHPCFGLDSGIQSPVLDGIRCIGGDADRYVARATDNNGNIGFSNAGWGPPDGPAGGVIAYGGYVAGQTRQWQLFYRDDSNAVCMTGQNTSQGMSIQFVY